MFWIAEGNCKTSVLLVFKSQANMFFDNCLTCNDIENNCFVLSAKGRAEQASVQ